MKLGYENIPLKREYGNREMTGFGCVFKSIEEYNYAQKLQGRLNREEIDSWQYEPELFCFGDDGTYTPDFKVTGGQIGTQYHEVKAKLSQKDVKRFRLMAEYHPIIYMVLVYPYCPRSGNQKRLIDNCRKYVKEIIYSRKIK